MRDNLSEECIEGANSLYDRLILVSPGGRDRGGGMGSVTDSIAQWFEVNNATVRVNVVDPRGTGTVALFPFHLIWALVEVVLLRSISRRAIIHIQMSERMSVLRKGAFVVLGRILGCATILHHHGAEFEMFYLQANPLLAGWTRKIANLAHLNIVLGRSAANFLIGTVGVPSDKVIVTPNAVADLRPAVMYAKKQTQDSAGIQPRAWRLLLLANLSPRKGVSEFLETVARLRSKGRQVIAILCGGGDIERYRVEARQLGLPEDAVEFTGWVNRSDVYSVLARSDTFVLPSFNEGLPMSILEAMSAEIPVITTPVGAIPEVVTDGVHCLLVPPGDAAKLTSAVDRLLSDPQLVQSLKFNARILYDDKFQMSSYMKILEEIYEKAVGSSKKSS